MNMALKVNKQKKSLKNTIILVFTLLIQFYFEKFFQKVRENCLGNNLYQKKIYPDN